MGQPTALTTVSIGKETTPGVGVVPTFSIPCLAPKPADLQSYVPSTAKAGTYAATLGENLGVNHPEFELDGSVYADAFGWPAAAILGDVTTTGANPYAHAIALLNSNAGQPKTYSITDRYSNGLARRSAGMFCNQLVAAWTAAGLLAYTSRWTGLTPSTTVAVPTAAYTAVPVMPAWRAAPSIGGSVVPYLLGGTITLNRPVKVKSVIDGSAAPHCVVLGRLSVTGTLDFAPDTDTELTRYLTNTQPALDLTWTVSTSNSVQFHATQCAYTSGVIDRSGVYRKDKIGFAAVANATDVGTSGVAGPCVVTLRNTLPSGTYA